MTQQILKAIAAGILAGIVIFLVPFVLKIVVIFLIIGLIFRLFGYRRRWHRGYVFLNKPEYMRRWHSMTNEERKNFMEKMEKELFTQPEQSSAAGN